MAYGVVVIFASLLILALAVRLGLTVDGAELSLWAICSCKIPILPKFLDFIFFDMLPAVAVFMTMFAVRPSNGFELFVRFFKFIDRFLTRATSPSLPPPRQNPVPRLTFWAGMMPV
jgi:hypothetical protein